MAFVENDHSVERTASTPVKNLMIAAGVNGFTVTCLTTNESTVCQKEDPFSEGSGARNYGVAKIGTF